MRFPALVWAFGCCAWGLGGVQAAEHAGTEQGVIEEVLVTAQRRDEALQDVPFSMTSVSEDDLFAYGIGDMDGIEIATSGLVLNQFFGYGMPFIRGLGSPLNGVGTEPSVALYVDGIYQPRASLYLPNLTDVQQVQVLKGPQSSLYGRNATAGAILVTTKRPTAGARVSTSLSYGSGNRWLGDLLFSGGSEEVAGSISAYGLRSDGFYENLVTGNDEVDDQEEWGVRGKVLLSLGDASDLTLVADSFKNTGTYGKFFSQIGSENVLASVFPGACYTGRQHKGCSETEARTADSIEEQSTGISLRWEVGFDGFDLAVVGGYRNHKRRGGADPDASSAPIFWFADTDANGGWGEDDDISSVEATLTSNGSGPFDWMVGAVFERQRSDYAVLIDAMAAGGFITTGTMDNEALSGFAEFGYDFGDEQRWRVSGGIRYISEEKEVRDAETTPYVNGGPGSGGSPLDPVPVAGSRREWNEPVFSATLLRQLGEGTNAYFRFAEGFRSGSFSHTNPAADPVDPEFNDAYTLGVKTEWLDGRLKANVEAFYYDITDLQVQAFDALEGAVTRNGGVGESRGADGQLELTTLSGRMSVSLDVTYLDTEYKDFPDAAVFVPCVDLGIDFPLNCVPGDPTSPAAAIAAPDLSGNEMLRSPDWSGSLALQYEWPTSMGSWAFGAIARYTDSYYFDPNNRLEQDATTRVNLTATYRMRPDGGLRVTFWVDNATDEKYVHTKEPIQFGDFAHWADPRTYGVTVGYSADRY